MDPQVKHALAFATAAHARVGQVRKYTGDPYIVHPIAVMQLVATVPHTPDMLMAALLHDTVEDTDVTQADIEREFGPAVGVLVYWLTDVSKLADGNRAVRKEMDRQHIAKAPPAAKTIKLADFIDNSRTIVKYGKGFAPLYMGEKEHSLEVLTEGDATLWAMARQIVDDYRAHRPVP